MSYYGCEFVFNGIPCSEFGLMIYDFGSNTQSEGVFQTGDISEDRIAKRYDALSYGLIQNKALEYSFVFGANIDSVDANDNLDRIEIEAISAWLTGYDRRKWLEIVQPDMESFRFLCYISELKLISYGNLPWAFSCKISCDSPFAYTFPEVYSYTVDGISNVNLFSRSSYNGYYKPKMEIYLRGSSEFSIINLSDNNRLFEFKSLPFDESLIILIDNKNQIITNSLDLNLYQYFNNKFFRMCRGDNIIKIEGNCIIKFICEFPVSIGS